MLHLQRTNIYPYGNSKNIIQVLTERPKVTNAGFSRHISRLPFSATLVVFFLFTARSLDSQVAYHLSVTHVRNDLYGITIASVVMIEPYNILLSHNSC